MIVLGETPNLVQPRRPDPVGPADERVRVEVERFLLFEARLLDEERYEEWLGLMTPDIHYWMPGVQARYRKDKTAPYSVERMAYFDDDMLNLRRRVTRFKQDTAWTEDPPTRHVHAVSNIEAEVTDDDREYDVRSVVLSVRGRNEAEEDWLIARRRDRLRRDGDGTLRLARRAIYVTQAVLLAKNLNVFL